MKKSLFFFLICLPVSLYGQEVLRVQNTASLTVQAGVELTVQGGITLQNGSLLTNNGTILIKRNGSSGTADWLDQTVTGYNHGTGTILLNSSGAQNFTSNNQFGRIELDNAGLILSSNALANQWYLKSGNVLTNAFYVQVLGTGSNDLQADAANPQYAFSWINGNLRRFISPASVNLYEFPVGNAMQAKLAVMENLTANPLAGVSYVDVHFGIKPGTDAGLNVSEQGTAYVSVNNEGVWFLTPNNTPSSGSYDLKLYLDGFSGLQDNRFAILKRDNASSNAADWQVPAGSYVNASGGLGRMVSHGYALRKNISGFSQFGIAQSSFALPVVMPDFFVKRSNRFDVDINWYSVTEENNRGFFVERRRSNEQSFSVAGYVPSKAVDGNSQVRLDYSLRDANSYEGISYYRIRQMDLDGNVHISGIKAIDGYSDQTISILVGPNPAKDHLQIRINSATATKTAFLLNGEGKNVASFLMADNYTLSTGKFPDGWYMLVILDAYGKGKHFYKKIVLSKQ